MSKSPEHEQMIIQSFAELQEASSPQPHQIYSHFTGSLYSVVTTSLRESDYEKLITYRSNATGNTWTRTLKEFLEKICVSPVRVPPGELSKHTTETPSGLIIPRFIRVEM